MPSSPVARNTDVAGGVITGSGVKLLLEGQPVAVIGDSVANHGPDDTPHRANPRMQTGAGKLRVSGKPVCRAIDTATCGHHPATTSVKLKVGGPPVDH